MTPTGHSARRSKSKLLSIIVVSLGTSAIAAPAPPPAEPAQHAPWSEVNDLADGLIRKQLIDPDSAVIHWTSGFQWGFIKNVMQPKQYGWVACGEYNAKNRMGGYVGSKPFVILLDAKGLVYFQDDAGDADDFLNAVSYHSTCREGPPILVNPELKAVGPSIPVGAAAPLSAADEIAKLAALRDRGIISPAEFEAQKAKLLAR